MPDKASPLFWATLVIEELFRNGVTHFCVSSGSRSSPLLYALSQHPRAESVIHFDERGSAFFALGLARSQGRPVCVITTSGTAVANLMPAVVEASEDNIPLVLISADRPPELRETGANQTTDQIKIFGSLALWFFDIPCPDDKISPEFVLSTIDQACVRANTRPAGPVHINMMFREPLLSSSQGTFPIQDYPQLSGWHMTRAPWTTYHPPRISVENNARKDFLYQLQSSQRGILLVGRINDTNIQNSVVTLANHLHWPVFADITSGVRFKVNDALAIHHHPLVFSQATRLAAISPDMALHIGGSFISKHVYEYLQNAHGLKYIFVGEHTERNDPLHKITHHYQTCLRDFCESIAGDLPHSAPSEILSPFKNLSGKIQKTISQYFDQPDCALSEPFIAHHISRILPVNWGIFSANSMPVRDLDTFAANGNKATTVMANRGASGIDGQIASACGYALATHKPVLAIMGDLGLLHDLNSLFFIRDLKTPFVILLINNNGGGIFSHLPIPSIHPAVFEKFFATPHNLTFSNAAGLFGLGYAKADTKKDFIASLEKSFQGNQKTLIEVSVGRQGDSLHRTLREMIQNISAS